MGRGYRNPGLQIVKQFTSSEAVELSDPTPHDPAGSRLAGSSACLRPGPYIAATLNAGMDAVHFTPRGSNSSTTFALRERSILSPAQTLL
jgi:hypothetical protein